MQPAVWAVVTICALGAPARADDATQALKQELGNLADTGLGVAPEGRAPPQVVIHDRVILAPPSYDGILGPWAHHGVVAAPVIGTTADGKVAWIATDLGFFELCGMAGCQRDPPIAETHATALFERGPHGWQPIAWDFARVLPGKEEALAKQHPPAAIPRAIAAGADDVVRQVTAALGSPAALAKLVSDRKDAVLYGSARKERFVGGAAARAKLLAWKLPLVLRDGVAAGLTSDKAAAWLVANVDATAPGARPTAYRLFAICERTPAGWRIVALNFSIPNEAAE